MKNLNLKFKMSKRKRVAKSSKGGKGKKAKYAIQKLAWVSK